VIPAFRPDVVVVIVVHGLFRHGIQLLVGCGDAVLLQQVGDFGTGVADAGFLPEFSECFFHNYVVSEKG
jgi:hypothetical protein